MNSIQEIKRINDRELELGIAGTPASWHETYKNSAWIYVGNLDKDLSEGDMICVLSQYGELEDLSLMRDDETGVSRGYGYAKYEDARSCVLAVDNLIGIQLCGRPLRVEHVDTKRLPEKLAEPRQEGDLANAYSMEKGQDLFAPPPPPNTKEVKHKKDEGRKKKRKSKKESKKYKKQKREKKSRRYSSSDDGH